MTAYIWGDFLLLYESLGVKIGVILPFSPCYFPHRLQFECYNKLFQEDQWILFMFLCTSKQAAAG